MKEFIHLFMTDSQFFIGSILLSFFMLMGIMVGWLAFKSFKI